MRIKQGDRSVVVENNQGEIKTGDEIHHHYYAQSPPPAPHQLPPNVAEIWHSKSWVRRLLLLDVLLL